MSFSSSAIKFLSNITRSFAAVVSAVCFSKDKALKFFCNAESSAAEMVAVWVLVISYGRVLLVEDDDAADDDVSVGNCGIFSLFPVNNTLEAVEEGSGGPPNKLLRAEGLV